MCAMHVYVYVMCTCAYSCLDHIKWLRWIPDFSPALTGLLEGFLPGAILILFMMLIPIILLAMAKYQGVPANSWQQRSVLRKSFIVQVQGWDELSLGLLA